MTVSTMLWATSGVGDGSALGYTDVQTQRMFRQLFQNDPTVQGVIAGADKELTPSVPGTGQIAVATGSAMIYGLHLYSNATTTLTLTTPWGDTGGIVWAGIDWVSQTGEINVTQNTSGNAAIPALVQTALTEWQIPICSYVIDSAGGVWTNAAKTTAGVTDLRRFIGMADLRIDYRQGGDDTNWNVSGSDNYQPSTSMMVTGSATTSIGGTVTVAFPTAFGGVPIILATSRPVSLVALTNLTVNDFDIETYEVDGTTPVGGITVFWQAIGPRA